MAVGPRGEADEARAAVSRRSSRRMRSVSVGWGGGGGGGRGAGDVALNASRDAQKGLRAARDGGRARSRTRYGSMTDDDNSDTCAIARPPERP